MCPSRVERLITCLLFVIFFGEGVSKPRVVRDSSPVFISSYAKVSRSGSVPDAHSANQSSNGTTLGELTGFNDGNCCGGDFKPSALIYVSDTDSVNITSTELPSTDEAEESRGYRTHPSRLIEAPDIYRVSNPPVQAEDRYAAKSVIKPKPKPSKVVKTTRPRPSQYQADFSDTLNSYQPPLPRKPYPPDGPPTSYNPGPPKTSYNPGPPSPSYIPGPPNPSYNPRPPPTSYGSPSLDLPDPPNKQTANIPYAPDYISSQGGQNQAPDSKMPDTAQPDDQNKPMKAAPSHPGGSDYNYNAEEYPQYPSEVMTPPKQNPNSYDQDPDAFLHTPPGMKKPAKHKPKPSHHFPHQDDGEISFQPPEKLRPKEPQIPEYPPDSSQGSPYMHGPGPQWIYKPETNEYTYPREEKERPNTHEQKKPDFGGIEYIDDEEFSHHLHHHGHPSHHHHHHHKEKPMKTTEKPMEDHESEDRQKKPYSYYYLGRKLWFIPLYFSVYFIIYVTALILKSIARHKISYPSLTEEGKKEERSGRNIQLDDTTDAVYRGIDKTRSRYRRAQ